MKTTYMATSAAMALMMLSVGGTMAQNYDAGDAVSTSRYGRMSCSAFTRLSRTEQASIVRKMAFAAPQRSLASPTVQPKLDKSGRIIGEMGNGIAVPNTPLTAGQIISACQAAPARSNVRDAFAGANGGPGLPFGGRR